MKKNIISMEHVSFCYKGAKKGLLSDVSLQVKEGEVLLLCGSSGSGKTTLIRMMNGLIPHYYPGEMTGEVRVKGYDIRTTPLYELAGVVGTVFQNPRSQFFAVDTDGEIVFGPENIGLDPEEIKRRERDVTEELHLQKLLGRSLFALSGGEKQKIACAGVSALLPDIILLDEPSSNLDLRSIQKLRCVIEKWKRQGKTIVICEHRLWYLKGLLDRVIYMEKGKMTKQWKGDVFYTLSGEKIRGLMLRPLELNPEWMDPKGENVQGVFGKEKREDGKYIHFKNYFFTYKRHPYLFWKKRPSGRDGKSLQLNIPDLSIPVGSVVGVVGPNGTGKSTFLRCVCGLERDCRGEIEAYGNTYRGRRRMGLSYLVMQDVNHQLFTDSVASEVMLSMKEKDEGCCEHILSNLGLLEYKKKHPMALSGGQKQRVAIASALAAKAKLLLFDEPTSGLDFAHMVKVGNLLEKIAKEGRTVLVSTHDPELIAMCCDYVLSIENGQVSSLKKVENKLQWKQ